MLDLHGFVAACNSTNFFIVVGSDDAPEVLTSDGRYCLAGIRRRGHEWGLGDPLLDKGSIADAYRTESVTEDGCAGS